MSDNFTELLILNCVHFQLKIPLNLPDHVMNDEPWSIITIYFVTPDNIVIFRFYYI